jgi:alkylation response protein AidB-like acyl-CoA dehydrogenase
MVGRSPAVLDLVVEHVQRRRQFGVPIGSFQAVKHMARRHVRRHRAGRALCHVRRADRGRATTSGGRGGLDGQGGRGRLPAAGRPHGVQLFGGLGFTWENDLQIYVRRAKVGEPLLGSTRRAPGPGRSLASTPGPRWRPRRCG